ncbi:MAG: DUF3343 domain-containing protein [Clostridia bacterium]|nr:DUF3343 domain-containing protein [Clostridia bacterium]
MTLIFSSVTYALKAQRLLAGHRIYTVLSRSPEVTAVRGCGYGLRLNNDAQLNDALQLLAEGGVKQLGTVME